MTITEIFFLIGFLSIIAITFLKLYNVMRNGEVYDITPSILLFVGVLFAWLVCMVSFMSDPEKVIFIVLYRLENVLMLFNVGLLILEVLFHLKTTAKLGSKKFNAMDYYKRG